MNSSTQVEVKSVDDVCSQLIKMTNICLQMYGKFDIRHEEKHPSASIVVFPAKSPDEIVIYSLWIAKEHRDKGVCQKWLSKLMEKDSGINKIMILAVSSWSLDHILKNKLSFKLIGSTDYQWERVQQ